MPVALSKFIGRVGEIATVAGLVRANRLVTITGSGGAGKTRLAQEVAMDLRGRDQDGVAWVEVVTAAAPEEIVALVAAAVGVKLGTGEALDILTRSLSTQRLVLVLDNCEHQVGEVSRVVHALLSDCPGVSILATSRCRLNLRGELTWRIPPLGLPGADPGPELDDLERSDAVTLFLDCGARVHQGLGLTDDNASAISGICHRLDGIPLAIELAASRCRVLSPQQILEGLDDALGLLGSDRDPAVRPRQRTIETSIAWSLGLLSESGRTLLRRLAGFRSPFSLEAVKAITPDSSLGAAHALDVLEELVDHSLLQVTDSGGVARYRLLETVRQFAERRLGEAGETEVLAARHAEWFGNRAKQLWPLYDGQMVERLDLADAEHDDFVAALNWHECQAPLERTGEVAHGFLAALGIRHVREATIRLDRIINGFGDQAPPVLGNLLLRRAEVLVRGGSMSLAHADRARALAIGAALGDRRLVAAAKASVVTGLAIAGVPNADELCLEAARACEAVRNNHDAMNSVMALMFSRHLRGDLDAVESVVNKAISYNARQVGCVECEARQSSAIAGVHGLRGEMNAAYAINTRARTQQESLREADSAAALRGHQLLLECWQGSGQDTLAVLEEMTEQALEQGRGQVRMWLYLPLSFARYVHGRTNSARNSLTSPVRDQWPWLATDLAVHLAGLEHACGEMGAAQDALATARRRNERFNNPQNSAQIDLRSGAIALDQSRGSDASERAQRALLVAVKGGYHKEAVLALELIAAIADVRGDPVTAGRLVGAAERRREELGLYLHLPPDRQRDERVAAASDGPARAEGRAMRWAQAVECASGAQSKRPIPGLETLTATELAVARCAADGLTNPQIAETLLMARETVKSHLANIFAKLGVNNRTKLAALVAVHRDKPVSHR